MRFKNGIWAKEVQSIQKESDIQMEEEWRSVKDYPNYEVNNLGMLRNATTKRIIRGYMGPTDHMYSLYNVQGKKNRTGKWLHKNTFPELFNKE